MPRILSDEHRSNLRNRLRSVRDFYLVELNTVRQFILTMEKTIKGRRLPFERSQLSIKDFDEAREIAELMLKLIRKPSREGKPFRIKSHKAGELLFHFSLILKHQILLSEMVLVHLIALEEALLKDYLQAILTSRRELLRSNATLTYEELCEMSSIESIVELMAEKEVEKLSRGDIDHAARYIRDRYHFSLEDDFKHWRLLRESYYRRNVFVHNR